MTRLTTPAAAMSLAAAICLGTSQPADASQPIAMGGYGFAAPFVVGYGASPATVPYFAAHPPVYYGSRQYRSYGTSPFAVPPGWPAVTSYLSARASTGHRVANPFVCRSGCSPLASTSETKEEKGEASTKPQMGLVQVNPFTVDDETLAIW